MSDVVESELHFAARVGRDDLLEHFLVHYADDVNIKEGGGNTPLMVASAYGNENFVKKLLKVDGLDLNCQNIMGRTALHLAARNNNSGCVKLLRKAPGLEWNLEDDGEVTPLLEAASSGSVDSLQIILTVRQVDLAATDENGDNVAWNAVLNGMDGEPRGDPLRCVQLLCKDPRVDWNTRIRDGNTPLLWCLEMSAKVGEEDQILLREMAKILLSNPRVDLNAQNKAGKFPETIAR